MVFNATFNNISVIWWWWKSRISKSKEFSDDIEFEGPVKRNSSTILNKSKRPPPPQTTGIQTY